MVVVVQKFEVRIAFALFGHAVDGLVVSYIVTDSPSCLPSGVPDIMTPAITATIQAKLTETEFHDGYKMYKRLKELI